MANASGTRGPAVTDTVRSYLVVWRSDRTEALQLTGVFNDAVRRTQQLLHHPAVSGVDVIDLAFRRVVYRFRRESR
jgi:hypothetical protein